MRRPGAMCRLPMRGHGQLPANVAANNVSSECRPCYTQPAGALYIYISGFIRI